MNPSDEPTVNDCHRRVEAPRIQFKKRPTVSRSRLAVLEDSNHQGVGESLKAQLPLQLSMPNRALNPSPHSAR